MLMPIDCESVEAGVLPVKAMDVPADYINGSRLKRVKERDVPSKDISTDQNVVALANLGYVDVPPYQAGSW